MDYPYLPTLIKKKQQQKKQTNKAWLFWSMERYIATFAILLFFYAAGQLFYRRIHPSRVMADTFGGE